jgi:endoglucanase
MRILLHFQNNEQIICEKKINNFFSAIRKRFSFLLIAVIILFSIISTCYPQTIVEQYGQLSVQGNQIVDKDNIPVQLRGMALYWSQWKGQFYNSACIQWLRDDWQCTVVRASMAVEAGGYLTNPDVEKNKVDSVVNASINLGIYVIIDWHDHNAQRHRTQAQNFFVEMAKEYGNYPNVIYEPFNEPLNTVSWADSIKPYLEAVIDSIRQYDPDNLIVCGSKTWSQDVDEASNNPIIGSNIVYSLHFYAATHKQWLRNKATTALNNGIALFATEYGTTTSSGSGVVDTAETRRWWKYLDQRKISHCNWSVADLTETSAALIPGASPNGGWDADMISFSGNFVRSMLLSPPDSVIPHVSDMDNSISYNISIYPNPVNDILSLMLPSDINKSVLSIYDNMGRLIINRNIENGYTTINMSSLAKGIYLVRITNNNQTIVKSVLKR